MWDMQATYLITAIQITDMATTIEAWGKMKHCQVWDLDSKAQAPLPKKWHYSFHTDRKSVV